MKRKERKFKKESKKIRKRKKIWNGKKENSKRKERKFEKERKKIQTRKILKRKERKFEKERKNRTEFKQGCIHDSITRVRWAVAVMEDTAGAYGKGGHGRRTINSIKL